MNAMEIIKIKALMKKHKINQTKLAFYLHTSKANVSNKLAGRRGFSIDDIRIMKAIFNLTNDEVCDIFLK